MCISKLLIKNLRNRNFCINQSLVKSLALLSLEPNAELLNNLIQLPTHQTLKNFDFISVLCNYILRWIIAGDINYVKAFPHKKFYLSFESNNINNVKAQKSLISKIMIVRQFLFYIITLTLLIIYKFNRFRIILCR